MTTMQASYGTQQQVALRRKIDSRIGWLIITPGACHAGRFFATDDPDLLGWDVIFDHLAKDGIFGFRLIPVEEISPVEKRLSARGYGIDYKDVFSARANTVREALRSVDLEVPEGYRLLDAEALGDPDILGEVQAFMAGQGVAPLSAAMLSGGHGPCSLIVITGQDGRIVATAFGYFPHNVHSPHEDTAWVGLVTVDPGHRGKGLGVLANALALRGMIEECGARRVYELVAPGDRAARRVAERCGLSLDVTVKSGDAVPGGGGRKSN